jgi:hypothetical protein
MTRSLIAALIVVIFAGGEVLAQGAFPAPLPGQPGWAAHPPATAAPPPTSAFPSNGAPPIGAFGAGPLATAEPSRECANGYTQLREDAENKGRLIAAARERRAPPDEACRLLDSFRAAEAKLIKYIETNAAKCAIPPHIAAGLNAGHKNTTDLKTKVCTLAEQMRRKDAPAGPTGDFWPTTTDAPI